MGVARQEIEIKTGNMGEREEIKGDDPRIEALREEIISLKQETTEMTQLKENNKELEIKVNIIYIYI